MIQNGENQKKYGLDSKIFMRLPLREPKEYFTL